MLVKMTRLCPLTSCFVLFFSLNELAVPATFVCLFGYLFCSSLRLNSQSSRDKVPAPRLAPHVSWNNLARHVLLGAHPLDPGLSHLFIEPTLLYPPLPPPHSALLTPHALWQQPLSSPWPQICANFLHAADWISPEAMSNMNYAEVLQCLIKIQLSLSSTS